MHKSAAAGITDPGYNYESAKTGAAVMSEASNEKPWPPLESAFKSALTFCAALAE